MAGKRKEKIVYIELKGTPAGTLLIAASRKGLLSLSLGKRSEKKFIESESKRFANPSIFITAGSFKWSGRNFSSKNLLKPSKLLLSKLDKTPFSRSEAKQPLRIINKTVGQLAGYFSGRLKTFHIKKDLSGLTDFEKKVLKELEKIPCGKTASYKEIARKIGNPKASRAVGNAVGKNPFAIIVPCHRVIKSNGALGGFSAPLSIKKNLLSHEKNIATV